MLLRQKNLEIALYSVSKSGTFFLKFFFFPMDECFNHIYACVSSACGGQKALDPLELELQTAVNARNQT